LIGADLERGAAQQVQGLTELPPPAALGFLGDLEASRMAGVVTGAEARSVGINWVFAPVCDLDSEPRNPIVQTRSFGVDPVRVGEHAAVWIRGLQEHGALGCAKHYPGHGRTTRDSHETLPSVPAPAAELQRTDVIPFEHAIRAGVGSVMSAFVAFPGWDPSGRAASFSSQILGYLRDPLNFGGLVVSDALIMAGASAAQPVPAATVSAVAAGCDALLYPDDFRQVVAALDHAVGEGAIPMTRADEALARYDEALAAWAGGADQGVPDLAGHAAFADDIAQRAVHFVRGETPRVRQPFSVAIVDDDVGGPYTVGPRDVFGRVLQDAGVTIGNRESGNGTRVVLLYSEPRSWKGRADLGARSLARLKRLAPGAQLVVLFGHPRLADRIPGRAPVLCAWHGQPLLQRAAARRLLTMIK
jgi:beta-glucosidase-like glycosyl hydrolase